MDADLLVDRRRLRRKLTFWRGGALLVAIIFLLVVGSLLSEQLGIVPKTAPHVAKVAVTGFISYNQPLLDTLKHVEDNNAAKALLLYIDSPGGSTAGSEALYNELRRIAAKKPVVAQIGTLGASGAYITALGADYIVSTQTSLVGSIGVLVQWAEFDKLMQTMGVRFEEVKTSPLKAAPNFFEPASEEAKAALKSLVDDSYAWFKNLVAERRHMSSDELAKVSDGRVFTGRQSIDLKLVDMLGDEQTARNWLAQEKKIAAALPLRTYKPEQGKWGGLFGSADSVASLLGMALPWLSSAQEPMQRLDGLVSVWQPSPSLNAASP